MASSRLWEPRAAIVWRDSSKAEQAANALKLTAEDSLRLKLVDRVVGEPGDGAHADYDGAAVRLGDALEATLGELKDMSGDELVEDRFQKFRVMGNFFEEVT